MVIGFLSPILFSHPTPAVPNQTAKISYFIPILGTRSTYLLTRASPPPPFIAPPLRLFFPNRFALPDPI